MQHVCNTFALVEARAERQELSHNIVGLVANLDDLNTTIYQNDAVIHDRVDELRTNMGAFEADLKAELEEQFMENQRRMDQAHERADRILRVVFFAILWLMLAWGWLGYEEAMAAQARADAETARVAHFKTKFWVNAWFLRDWVVTVSYAGYRRFLWNWVF